MPQRWTCHHSHELQVLGHSRIRLPRSMAMHCGSMGRALANDMDDPQVRAALLRAVQGKELRNGRILHGGFFLGPRDFYDKLRGSTM